MRKIGVLLVLLVALFCLGACKNVETAEEVKETEEILLPNSYLNFANSDVQEAAEYLQKYCEKAEIEDEGILLEVTEEQKLKLLEIEQDDIDDCMLDFTAANERYSCELSEDYSKVVYSYDENIDDMLQARVLSVTLSQVLKGILMTGNSDWSIEVVVKNCHTGNVVAEGVLPEGGLHFDTPEWEASYIEE